MSTQEQYLYCLIRDPGMDDPLRLEGILGMSVHVIRHQGLGAVVSRMKRRWFTATWENLIAHELVIEKVIEHYTVLPVRFGIIARSACALRDCLLEPRQDEFLELIHQFAGKKEVILKAFWNPLPVVDDRLKKKRKARQRPGTMSELTAGVKTCPRLDPDRKLEGALIKRREGYRRQILRFFRPMVVDHNAIGLNGNHMVANEAFLIESVQEPGFDEGVELLQEQFGNDLYFSYVAFTPPYHFVNLDVSWEGEDNHVPAA